MDGSTSSPLLPLLYVHAMLICTAWSHMEGISIFEAMNISVESTPAASAGGEVHAAWDPVHAHAVDGGLFGRRRRVRGQIARFPDDAGVPEILLTNSSRPKEGADD
jgi:hypothetical protein